MTTLASISRSLIELNHTPTWQNGENTHKVIHPFEKSDACNC